MGKNDLCASICLIGCGVFMILILVASSVTYLVTLPHIRDGCPVRTSCNMYVVPNDEFKDPCIGMWRLYIDGNATDCYRWCKLSNVNCTTKCWGCADCSVYKNGSSCDPYGLGPWEVYCPKIWCAKEPDYWINQLAWFIMIVDGSLIGIIITITISVIVGSLLITACKRANINERVSLLNK